MKLINGVEIPDFGFGTYKIPNNEIGVNAIKEAINDGYTLIDTAAGYGNEEAVAKAISLSNKKREDLFITTKLKNADQGYESTLKAFENSLEQLNTDYIDLYLVHWPITVEYRDEWKTRLADSWKAIEELYNAKKIRAIGVCNFLPHHFEVLKETAKIMPMLNQIEFNPTYQQIEAVNYSKVHNILVEAWGTLIRGDLDNELLVQVANRRHASPACICLAFARQSGIIPLSKSIHPRRIKENLNFQDIELTEDDMNLLRSMNTTTNYTFHPDRNEEWGAKLPTIK